MLSLSDCIVLGYSSTLRAGQSMHFHMQLDCVQTMQFHPSSVCRMTDVAQTQALEMLTAAINLLTAKVETLTSRLANVETRLANVETRLANVECVFDAYINARHNTTDSCK